MDMDKLRDIQKFWLEELKESEGEDPSLGLVAKAREHIKQLLDALFKKEKPQYGGQIKEIIDYLNKKIATRYKYDSASVLKHIPARLSEGYSVQDFKDVIDKKAKEWLNSDLAAFLRPETLFGSKFEAYLNQKGKVSAQGSFDVMEFI